MQFRRTTGDRWYDANSWHQAALPSPVPHVERVPCAGDSVLFPDNMTYRALVQHPVAVAALTLGPYVSEGGGWRRSRRISIHVNLVYDSRCFRWKIRSMLQKYKGLESGKLELICQSGLPQDLCMVVETLPQ